MKKFLYKELVLSAHPTLFIFMSLGVLVLIPGYPYSVVFMFGCLAPSITFMYGRETKDIYYTALLPVKRSDVVKGKVILIIFAQIIQVLISGSLALLKGLVNMDSNVAGIDANFAYFGMGLILFSLFNSVFISEFFKTTTKVGKSFLLAMIPVLIMMIIMEVSGHLPFAEWLDKTDEKSLLMQLPFLISGLLIYPVSIFLSYKLGVKNFRKVDL